MTFSDTESGDELAALKAHYRFAEWPTRLEENLLIWNLTLSGHELPGWGLSDPPRVDPVDRPRSIQSWWRPESGDDGQLVRLDLVQGDSVHDGREHLLRFLGEAQLAPVEVDSIGDVAFTIEEEDAVFFGRANLAVRMRNAARTGVSMREPAIGFDRWLLNKETVDRGVPPRIESFRVAGDERPMIGRASVLEIEATDPLDRPVSYKIFARLGELQIVENVVSYLATSEGTDEITLIAISADGSTATTTQQLDILGAG